MPGILLDLRTGEPILENGDYIEIDDNYAFYQIIDNLLNTQTGSEIWNIYYGFDLRSAIRINSQGAPTEIIKSLLADALDSNKERLIYAIDTIESWRDGQQLHFKIAVKSKLGDLVVLEEGIPNAV